MPCECPNCRKDNILNGTLIADCSCCSTRLSATLKFQVMPDKSLVCDDCVTKHYCSCGFCNKSFKKDGMKKAHRTLDDNSTKEFLVCERCFNQNYRECMECHNYFDRHSIMAHGDKCYCRVCFNKSYKMCGVCNTIHPKTAQMLAIFNGTALACDNCYGKYGPINKYETKAQLAFHGIPPHYEGVELEVELDDGDHNKRGWKAKEVVDLFEKDFVITKEDGSIRCGFEIVTQPATLSEQIRRWTPFFDKLPKNLKSFNTTNCGLHVHCAKKPLSLLTIAKIVVFVNDDPNKEFVETIAGRRSNTYSCLQKKEHATVKRIGNLDRGNRYEAVNLVNHDTIEFRIFKGTLKRESFFKALEFCDALIKFCMTGNNSIQHCRNKENFMAYVTEHKKDYPYLYAFICAKFLKTETKQTKAYGFVVEGLPQTPQPPQPNQTTTDNSSNNATSNNTSTNPQ